jgi:hypothetical protein
METAAQARQTHTDPCSIARFAMQEGQRVCSSAENQSSRHANAGISRAPLPLDLVLEASSSFCDLLDTRRAASASPLIMGRDGRK